MSDDYLWDGSGTPDPGVQRIEALLGRLRTPLPPAPRIGDVRPRDAAHPFRGAQSAANGSAEGLRYIGIRFLAPALAAAAAIIVMIALTWRTTPPPSWEVARISGATRIGSTPLTGTGRLAVGQTLATDAASRARVDVGTIGQVTVDASTSVRLVATRKGRHQLALEHGTLHAFITAPPGQFVVNTPSSTATDLGCVYSLTVDEDGTGMLSVTAGWVAFEFKGRESFVPARASSRTDPAFGPGTPRYDDAAEGFRQMLDRFDADRDPRQRADALGYVLDHARPKDAMTIWHLVSRVDVGERARVVRALSALAPMPSGVREADVLRLDRAALDQWWDSLGLRDTGWWRKWKGPYPAAP